MIGRSREIITALLCGARAARVFSNTTPVKTPAMIICGVSVSYNRETNDHPHFGTFCFTKQVAVELTE